MTTTLQQFADALGALAIVGAHETGIRRFLAGHSYERCATDAERDGWVAAWDDEMEMQKLLSEILLSEMEPA